jgi:hypothetical protein
MAMRACQPRNKRVFAADDTASPLVGRARQMVAFSLKVNEATRHLD